MEYVVYSYEAGTPPKCEVYGVVDMQGPKPGGNEECEALAAEIRAQHPTATVMAVPFGAYQSTANQWVVKEAGTYEGKPDTVEYFGPFPTRADAESGQHALAPGGGHEDMQDAVFEILEVTAAELADLPVQGLPE